MPIDREPGTRIPDSGRADAQRNFADLGGGAGADIVTADPTSRFDGMMWFRSDLHELRADFAGTVYKVALVPA